MIPTGEKISGE